MEINLQNVGLNNKRCKIDSCIIFQTVVSCIYLLYFIVHVVRNSLNRFFNTYVILHILNCQNIFIMTFLLIMIN